MVGRKVGESGHRDSDFLQTVHGNGWKVPWSPRVQVETFVHSCGLVARHQLSARTGIVTVGPEPDPVTVLACVAVKINLLDNDAAAAFVFVQHLPCIARQIDKVQFHRPAACDVLIGDSIIEVVKLKS